VGGTRAGGGGARRKLASSMYDGIPVRAPGGGAAPFNMAALKKELQDKHQRSEGERGRREEEGKKSEEGGRKVEEGKKKTLFSSAFRKGAKDKDKDKDKEKGSWQYKCQKEKKARENAERLRSKAEDEKDRLIELVAYLYSSLVALGADQDAGAADLRQRIADLHQQVLAKDRELGLELKEDEALVSVQPLPNSRVMPRPPPGAAAAAKALAAGAKPGRRRMSQTSRKDSFNELRKINESRSNLRQLMQTAMKEEAAAVARAAAPPAEPEKPLTEEERKLRQRENTVKELVDTEAQFQFDCAEMIITNFMVPLRDVLNEEDLQAVFSNVEDIVPFSTELRRELTAVVAVPPDQQMIGEFFLKKMEGFYVFTQYCVNQPYCLERLKVLQKKNSQFRSVVEQRQARPVCQGLRLEDFLIKPVQRVCKYPLLLRAIVKATDESHPDHANLTQAMQRMEEVLSGINATKASTENAQKIQEIEAKFDELELQAESRTFILEGSLKKAVFNPGVGEDSVTGRAMFLFNDILLLAKYQGKKLHLVTVFPVEHCLVWDVTVKDKHAFQVMRNDKKQSMVCYCDSDKDKDKWMHHINTAISDSFGAW